MRELFSSRDIEKILGIGPDKLSYWVRTKRLIKPSEVGKGRGKVNFYSIDDLFYLALIKKLEKYGIELNFIKEIIEGENIIVGLEKWKALYTIQPNVDRKKLERVWKRNILKLYRFDRQGFKKEGLLLMIENIEGLYVKSYGWSLVILDRVKRGFRHEIKGWEPKEIILIDITKIIEELENGSGVKV